MEVGKLGVVGAGQMGEGISQVAEQSGLDVIIVDAAPDFAQTGIGKIKKQLERLVEKGKTEAGRGARRIDRHRHQHVDRRGVHERLDLRCSLRSARLRIRHARRCGSAWVAQPLPSTSSDCSPCCQRSWPSRVAGIGEVSA